MIFIVFLDHDTYNHQKSSYTEQYLYDPGTPRSCLHLAVGEVRPIAFALPLIQAETRGAAARPSTASSTRLALAHAVDLAEPWLAHALVGDTIC